MKSSRLPDKASTLSSKPEFSVRFANQGIWEEATGLNVLASFTAK